MKSRNINFFKDGAGEMATRFREMNWSETALGPVKHWPQSLRTAVSIILKSDFPMFIAWGPKRIFLYNDAYAIILGAKNKTALGQQFEIIWKEIWPDIAPLIEKVDNGKAVYLEDMQLVMNRKGFDETTYFTFSYSPIRDEDDQVGGLFCACVETTARINAERLLKAEQEKFRAMFSQAPFPMAMLEGPQHRFTYTNKNYRDYFLGGRDVTGKSIEEVFPEVKSQGYIDILDTVYRSGERYIGKEAKFELSAADGSPKEYYLTFVYEPMKDAQGKVEGILAAISDITEAVISRKQLEAERAKFEAAFHAVADGIFIFDSNGNPVFMNDAAAKVFGAASAADVRQRVEYYFERLDLFDLDGNLIPISEWPVSRVLRGESFRDWQIKAHRRDTGDRWIWSTSGELAKQPGLDASLAVVVLRDITDQKRAEEEIKEAKREAEHANELKSAFLANMSHEIRTPLGAMLGFADLLRDQNLSEKEFDSYIDILARNGEQLSFIINDILDLSKVEAGHLALEFIPTDSKDIAANVVSLLTVKAREKDLSLTYEADPTTTEVISDPLRVRQVLLNLVSNAIKFTQSGSVKIKSYSYKNSTGRKIMAFEVTDTGMGIPPDQVERIFDVFVQGDGSMTRRFGGTGLGLALSRKLAQKLGGDIVVKNSAKEKGSTFLFTFEDRPEALEKIQAPLNNGKKEDFVLNQGIHPLEGISVLVVDDSQDNRELISHVLQKAGASVASADNGVEGYKKALSENPDVVLMDIQMPVMDGYTATERLRSHGYQKPIVALTAHAMTEVRKKCLNVGCSDHLTKPINTKELITTIARLNEDSTESYR